MQIGLDLFNPDTDDEFIRDLGVTWTKKAAGIGSAGEECNDLLAHLDYCRSLGIRPVVDLRFGATHERLVELQRDGGSPADAEAQDIIAGMAAGAADIARQAGDLCHDWEVFGEYDCPLVGGQWPNKHVVYSAYLTAIHAAVKAVQPWARVWNGGWGVQLQDHFIPPLVEECPEAFEVCNWHHYNIYDYWPKYGPDAGDLAGKPRYDAPIAECAAYTADLFREMFTRNRALLTEHGMTQPFASSEWGMATVPREAIVGNLRALELDSETLLPTDNPLYPLDGQGLGLCDEDAAVYMDAWFQAFEDSDLEVCIVHRLRDTPMAKRQYADCTFWGHFCGLLFETGEKKAVYDVVKQWAARDRARIA